MCVTVVIQAVALYVAWRANHSMRSGGSGGGGSDEAELFGPNYAPSSMYYGTSSNNLFGGHRYYYKHNHRYQNSLNYFGGGGGGAGAGEGEGAEPSDVLWWVASALLGMADSGTMTVIYAALAERFPGNNSNGSSSSSSSSSSNSNTSSTGVAGGGGGGGGGAGGSSIQEESHNDGASRPLLQLSNGGGGSGGSSSNKKGAANTPSKFDSSDGFSALFFLQSVAIGMLFFLMPVFANESTGMLNHFFHFFYFFFSSSSPSSFFGFFFWLFGLLFWGLLFPSPPSF